MRIEDWKSLSRAVIQCMNLGSRLNHLRVLSMKSNEMLSNALEKSICSMRPGRLFCLACWNMSNMFLVTSPMYLPGKYAFYQGLISLSNMGFRRLVRTPDGIL